MEECDYCGKMEIKKDDFSPCELGGMICPNCEKVLKDQDKK